MKKLLALCLFFSFSITKNLYATTTPNIHVRIAHSQQSLLISGLDLSRYIWPKKSWKTYKGFKKIEFNCKSKAHFSKRKPIRLALVRSGSGFVSINGEKYRGKFHIQTSENFNGCDVINDISLEDYLATLLPKEMNTNWPIEALKAQAVAARSYAYYKIKTNQVSRAKGFRTNYHLESSEKHQVSGSFYDATRKTVLATSQTGGEILMLKSKKITPIFFHSKCGGKTLIPKEVWKNEVEGYRSVECPFCHKHGKKDWRRTYNKLFLADNIQRVIEKYNQGKTRLDRNSYYVEGNAQNQTFINVMNNDQPQIVKKSRLRDVLGRTELPSNFYTLKDFGQYVEVNGSGFGHGVGMCQFGAKELAIRGYNYKQILAYYFPELNLMKIY